MGQRLTLTGKVNRHWGAVGKPSLNRAQTSRLREESVGVDPKPGELAMGRVKVR